MASFLTHSIAGEIIDFFSLRAAFWAKESTLILADLHLGKPYIFRDAGIPIPDAIFAEDLQRLSTLVDQTRAERILILGDFLHSPKKLAQSSHDLFFAWRQKHSLEIGVVQGNHDGDLRNIPTSWNIKNLVRNFNQGIFCFRHDPLPHDSLHVWAGHIHPMLSLRSKRDRLRLPCFWLKEQMTILPSFSLFTRGCDIELSLHESAIMLSEDQLFPIHGPPKHP